MWTKSKEKEETPETPATLDLSALAQPATQLATEPKPSKLKTPDAMLTPENQAYTNNLISEAVKGVFAQLGPLLESIALTPEKLAQAEALRRAPDPALVARELRERKLMQQDQEENRANLLRTQAACIHKYPTGQWAVNPIHNYPDRQERFICSLCQSFFEPRRWTIQAPDAENPRGKAVIVDAHPQYHLVREVLSTRG